jgi:hypothetical protein
MGQRPNRDKTKISQFQGCCLPMAESLLVSPHWEFGISHRQLENKLQLFSNSRKPREE